ncbi:MAG: ABC transporter ATP-binding protein [Methanobacteriota archaeon]|nr:MAG: ABC transporter ATP-binding protein [Euryarchaeota archaeon]
MTGAALKLVMLGKQFEAKVERLNALRDVNLEIREGEFVTIVGPSGCGKSTLLMLVAGLQVPTAGWVEMDGQPVHGPGADRVVVFQDGALFPWLDVQGNVEFGLRVAGVRRAKRAQRVREFIKMVQLEKFAHARVHELSGGMKQRVALARALVLRPRVLLMDEPFAALDVHTREEMQSVVQDLWLRSGTTTLFVTHDVRESAVLGDRIVVMTHRPGTVSAILENHAPRPRTLNDPEVLDAIQRSNDILKAEVEWSNSQAKLAP